MNRRMRLVKLACCLSVGAYVMQAGGCFSIAANSLLAGFPTGQVATDIGLWGLCGTPNVQVVDENGVAQGEILNTEDDLVFFCPVTIVVQATDTGGGDGGGTGDGG